MEACKTATLILTLCFIILTLTFYTGTQHLKEQRQLQITQCRSVCAEMSKDCYCVCNQTYINNGTQWHYLPGTGYH